MSLYAIKDEDGELRDLTWDSPNITKNFWAYTDINVSAATAMTDMHRGSHVVELVEKAEPVEESKEVASYLAGLKAEITVGSTGHYANYYVRNLRIIHDMSIEDIFRALDVGWTVKQPKRWYVKAPKELSGNEKTSWFYKGLDGDINTVRDSSRSRTFDEQFTAEEIERYRLGGFETVGVED